MLTVACVLRSGGEYGVEHVAALEEAVAAHLPLPYHFQCLHDADPWPGWWAKIGLFTPGRFSGPVLYFDLDTVIVGDLSDLAGYAGPLAMLNDFIGQTQPASGVMAWTPGPHTDAIHTRFVADPRSAYRMGGDQDFIRSVVGDGVDRLQDLYPGQLVSYKRHCTQGLPPGARVVCFHGRPKANDFPKGHWARGRLPAGVRDA